MKKSKRTIHLDHMKSERKAGKDFLSTSKGRKIYQTTTCFTDGSGSCPLLVKAEERNGSTSKLEYTEHPHPLPSLPTPITNNKCAGSAPTLSMSGTAFSLNNSEAVGMGASRRHWHNLCTSWTLQSLPIPFHEGCKHENTH